MLAALVGWGPPAAAASAARARWPFVVHGPTIVMLDSLSTLDGPAAGARLDSLLAAARAGRDTAFQMVLEIKLATWREFAFGALDQALAAADRWEPTVRALHDTLAWCWVLRLRGYAQMQSERYPEARQSYDRMLALSRRARLEAMEGYALLGTSWLEIQAGNNAVAERGYRRALVLLEPEPSPFGYRTARAGLANTLSRQGRIDESRIEYQRVLEAAHAGHDVFNEAAALNDLGVLESAYGDPSIAEPYFRAAAALNHRMRLVSYELNAIHNAALCMMRDGRNAAAATLLDSLARASAAAGARDNEMRALGDLGNALAWQGRHAEAESVLVRALALTDSSSFAGSVDVMTTLAWVELQTGRAPAAHRRLEEWRAEVVRRASPGYLYGFLLVLARAQREIGEPRAGIGTLRTALAALPAVRGAVGSQIIEGEMEMAECFRALGMRDSTLAHLRLASQGWESHRADPSNLEWRRAYDRAAPQLYALYLAALLDPARGGSETARAAEAFDVMQRFRSRTLEDQLRGAQGREQPPRIPLARLQTDVLRPGEVLLDIFCSPDTSIVFAVTRSSCRAAWSPGLWAARARLGRLRSLLATPDASEQDLVTAESSLGLLLLGPVADEVRAARTVLVSSGWLNDYPLGMLRLPGENEPLVARRGFAYVPSATMLAAGRAAAPGRATGTSLAGFCRSTDAAGRKLPGVDSEARWLQRRFPAARVRTNDGSLTLAQMLGGRMDAEVIHVASHTRLSAASPWRSGFLLGRGEGEEAWLTADRIARLPAPARVCVLAGCSSAGVVSAPEGMPNLAAAWLTAGAGCVVATQWPVEDQATSRLVEQLYETFAHGATVGEALTAAQRVVRAEHPEARYWAGFVLLGDPAARVATLGKPGMAGTPAR